MKARTLLSIVIVTLMAFSGCRKKYIVSSAMSPTIKPGESFTVDYSAYVLREPRRWDVVVFEPPMYASERWVMRVVALPGETVSVSSDGITINGRLMGLPPYVKDVSYVVAGPYVRGYVVPKASYYVLGDNSRNANDSRFWGAVSKWKIYGRVRKK